MKPLETPLNSTQKLKYAAVRNILFMFLNLIKKKKKKPNRCIVLSFRAQLHYFNYLL